MKTSNNGDDIQKFPHSPSGIQQAIKASDELGNWWWEEFVDWSTELTTEEPEEKLALLALAQEVLHHRSLFDEEQIQTIHDNLVARGMPGLLSIMTKQYVVMG